MLLTEEIRAFLLNRGGLLNWRSIEIEAGLEKNSLKVLVYANQSKAIEENLSALMAVLEKVGFSKPDASPDEY